MWSNSSASLLGCPPFHQYPQWFPSKSDGNYCGLSPTLNTGGSRKALTFQPNLGFESAKIFLQVFSDTVPIVAGSNTSAVVLQNASSPRIHLDLKYLDPRVLFCQAPNPSSNQLVLPFSKGWFCNNSNGRGFGPDIA